MIIALLFGCALHFDLMWPCRQRVCVVGGVTVRLDVSISFDRGVDDMFDAILVVARRMKEAHTPTLFGCHQNHGFIAVLAADMDFVDLNTALQAFSVFPNHRAANAMRPGPGGLVGAEPQNTLKKTFSITGLSRMIAWAKAGCSVTGNSISGSSSSRINRAILAMRKFANFMVKTENTAEGGSDSSLHYPQHSRGPPSDFPHQS